MDRSCLALRPREKKTDEVSVSRLSPCLQCAAHQRCILFPQAPSIGFLCLTARSLGKSQTRTHAHIHAHTHARTHTHTYACTHTYTHSYARTHAHAHTRTHARTHTHTHTHQHARLRSRAHAHTHTHTYTHVHTHTHTYICRFRSQRYIYMIQTADYVEEQSKDDPKIIRVL